MGTYGTIIAQINAILAAVPGVGTKIYNYDRLSTDWNQFLSSFKSGSKILGWGITRPRALEEEEASSTNEETTTWIIRGYYSLDNYGASETTFQNLCDDIRAAFRAKQDLNGACLTHHQLQMDIFEARMFGSVLCHYVEFRLETVEQVSY